MEEKDQEIEENEKQHIHQSEIYKKEIARAKKSTDDLASSVENLKKLYERLAHVFFSVEQENMAK